MFDALREVGWLQSTGWRRLIGSPQLQIIFHKRATKYRALLLKMTCKDKGSYGSLPPCIFKVPSWDMCRRHTLQHCNTLQHTATPCSTLQHTAAHCNTLQHTATRTHCNAIQEGTLISPSWDVSRCALEGARTFDTHCNALQHTATPSSTLQHAAP